MINMRIQQWGLFREECMMDGQVFERIFFTAQRSWGFQFRRQILLEDLTFSDTYIYIYIHVCKQMRWVAFCQSTGVLCIVGSLKCPLSDISVVKSARTSAIYLTSLLLIWVPTWWWARYSWVLASASCGLASKVFQRILHGWSCCGSTASSQPCYGFLVPGLNGWCGWCIGLLGCCLYKQDLQWNSTVARFADCNRTYISDDVIINIIPPNKFLYFRWRMPPFWTHADFLAIF